MVVACEGFGELLAVALGEDRQIKVGGDVVGLVRESLRVRVSASCTPAKGK